MKKFFVGICVGIIGVYAAALVYIGVHLTTDSALPSDAIVILGAPSEYKHMLNPCLRARVEQGVKLYNNGIAQKLIMSGGTDGIDKQNQAYVMAALARQQGVPSEDILLEAGSENTYENLLFTKKILDKQGLKSIIIVSDPYHLPRAGLIAKTLGIPSTVSPALASPCWDRYKFLSFAYFRDAGALLHYLLTGKIAFTALTR